MFFKQCSTEGVHQSFRMSHAFNHCMTKWSERMLTMRLDYKTTVFTRSLSSIRTISANQTIMFEAETLTELQSTKSILRLEQIAGLRARGISDQIDLPQLYVEISLPAKARFSKAPQVSPSPAKMGSAPSSRLRLSCKHNLCVRDSLRHSQLRCDQSRLT